jgi:acyl-CoA thioester hydrolase
MTKLSLRLDWSEMDLFGHINNVSFFKYIQSARVNYWEVTGIPQISETNKIGSMLASSSCQMKRPLFYPGNILIESWMEYIKNSSFSIHHRMLIEKGELSAEAQDVMVLYDFNKNEKVLFPQSLKEKIEQQEGRRF